MDVAAITRFRGSAIVITAVSVRPIRRVVRVGGCDLRGASLASHSAACVEHPPGLFDLRRCLVHQGGANIFYPASVRRQARGPVAASVRAIGAMAGSGYRTESGGTCHHGSRRRRRRRTSTSERSGSGSRNQNELFEEIRRPRRRKSATMRPVCGRSRTRPIAPATDHW
jgi:hypothetical protein